MVARSFSTELGKESNVHVTRDVVLILVFVVTVVAIVVVVVAVDPPGEVSKRLSSVIY